MMATIAQLRESRQPEEINKMQDDILLLQSSAYPGQGLNRRLDASVEQARRVVSSHFHADAIRELQDEWQDDIDQALQEADRDSQTRWKDWRRQASAGGRGLHRLTQVRQVQAPTTVVTSAG
eukprot:7859717-Pyramimonas_sp.AAC.1